MRPPADLLDRLTHFRLAAGGNALSHRPGERRSSARGAGMEFAGNRPYREGDDIRHLDSGLFARLRQPYLREYLADRQLRVAILIDTSRSMAVGDPPKTATASMLAGVLGYAALSSGDLVEIGMARGDRIHWSDPMQGSSRAEILFRWLARAREPSDLSLEQQIRIALPLLRRANLSILLSDWWLEDLESELQVLRALGRGPIVVQVTAKEEEDPLLLGQGPLRVQDAEAGATLDITLDRASAAEYQRLLGLYRQKLRAGVSQLGGRYIATSAGLDSTALLSQLVQDRVLEQYGQ